MHCAYVRRLLLGCCWGKDFNDLELPHFLSHSERLPDMRLAKTPHLPHRRSVE